ncbi:hypothetical protein Barb6XT_02422 [Bacteroidales bacterium Barb6XT]|nr:hypothetical protein Barb6XT_02422 [Bacteroidales bacterium Barb6XT]
MFDLERRSELPVLRERYEQQTFLCRRTKKQPCLNRRGKPETVFYPGNISGTHSPNARISRQSLPPYSASNPSRLICLTVHSRIARLSPQYLRDCSSAYIEIISDHLFSATFSNCTSLATLPAGLFSTIQGDASTYMFYYTFYG